MNLRLPAVAVLFGIVSMMPLKADLECIEQVVIDAGLAKADDLFRRHDIPGLMEMLRQSHLFVSREVALRLGRLGAREAVEDLRRLDGMYARFACAPSGQFAVAMVLIENPDNAGRRSALLELATKNPAAAAFPGSAADVAGRELSSFDGADIETRLAAVDTYGAQFTVLALQCRRMPEAERIVRYVEVMEKHDSALRAEAAESLLISSGKPALAPVRALKARVEAQIRVPTSGFSVKNTILSRCDNIIRILEK